MTSNDLCCHSCIQTAGVDRWHQMVLSAVNHYVRAYLCQVSHFVTSASDWSRSRDMGNNIGLGSDVIVTVQTGGRKLAGTDATVWIRAHDEEGNKSDEIKLNQLFETNFELGKKDVFEIARRKFSDLKSPIDKIEIWRDYTGMTSTWFLETVVVEDPDFNVIYTFPVFRWLLPNYRYIFQQYDTSLPADDIKPEQRQLELGEKQRMYKLSGSNPRLPVQVAQVPDDEEFPEDFERGNIVQLTGNRAPQLKKDSWRRLEDLSLIYSSDVLYIPICQGLWQDDAYFGYQRLNGVNPGLIQLCTQIPDKIDVSSNMLKPFLEGQSLKSAMKAKRIFISDLSLFHKYICPDPDTTICSPIALFYLNKSDTLVPVAIQLFQETKDSNPIFLPSDDRYTWLLAKMWFSNAEANHHMAVTFIGSTCLMMGSVGVSLHRNFSVSHPLYKLLVPYFTNIMAENSDITQSLLVEDGLLDRVMAIGSNGVKRMVQKSMEAWSLSSDSCLPDNLLKRGVFDARVLPGYFYRDDGMLLYYTIQNYVIKYMTLYYQNAQSIADDTELQNWVREMGAKRTDGGLGIQGLPGNGTAMVQKPEQLQDLLTTIIFTCTVQRAAVSAPQYDVYGVPPNYPLKLHGKPPADKTPRSERDVLDALQTDTDWEEGVALASVLSTPVNRGVLGKLDNIYIYDPRAVEVHERFTSELEEIGRTIRERNTVRIHSYHYLIPSSL